MPVMARKTTEKTAVGERRGHEREKGDTRLLSLREKVSCPLLSRPLFPSAGRYDTAAENL
jgi:hypothetical protein